MSTMAKLVNSQPPTFNRSSSMYVRLVNLQTKVDSVFMSLQAGQNLVDLFAAERPLHSSNAQATHRTATGIWIKLCLQPLEVGRAVAKHIDKFLGCRERLALGPFDKALCSSYHDYQVFDLDTQTLDVSSCADDFLGVLEA
jgi:hypothetical protein